MKSFKTISIFSFFLGIVIANAQNVALKVGTNPTTIDAKAVLEIESTTKGLLLPRMTTTQRNAIGATLTTRGLQIYDTTISGVCVFNGYAWECSKGNNTGDTKAWLLGGNAGTNPGVDFIGTTDAKDLVLGASFGRVRISQTARLSFSSTSGANSNLFIGGGNETTTGSWNVAFGQKSFDNDIDGYNNTAIGNEALRYSTTGYSNTAIGSQALFSNNIGSFNTALGHRALYNNLDGFGNTVIGDEAGITIDTGSNNTVIGYSAAYGLTTGVNNTILGANVTNLAANLSNNIILADGSGNQRINVDSNGKVGIGNPTPVYNLDVIGTIGASAGMASNFYGTYSDIRLKRNIKSIDSALRTVAALHPVSYEKKESIDATDYKFKEDGFIAQELRKVLPDLVTAGPDKNKTLSVNYTAIIPILTKAIQEQQLMIEKQQAQINELKALILVKK